VRQGIGGGGGGDIKKGQEERWDEQ